MKYKIEIKWENENWFFWFPKAEAKRKKAKIGDDFCQRENLPD